MRPTVTVLTTGGTIASTDDGSGATPTERGHDVVSSVPGLSSLAELTVEPVSMVASSNMDFETLGTLTEAAREAASSGVDGIVVTHGTSTIEESAYYLDLCLDLDVPVVFTGAQRRPDQRSADGPANLYAAVRAASNETLRPAGGVYVAMNDELHAARHVTKSHTYRLDGFESPEVGPIARFAPDGLDFVRPPGSRSVSIPVTRSTATVDRVSSGVGVDATQLERAVAAGVDGLVIDGTGLGNTTASLADGIVSALDAGVPTVITSRCHAGPVASVYGYHGGNRWLIEQGALNGDDLPAHKARVKLRLALAAVSNPMDVVRYF